MSNDLHQQIQALRDHLQQHPPIDPQRRNELEMLIEDLDRRLENEDHPGDLSARVKYAAERFEAEHPSTASVLRNVLQALAAMGI